MAFNFFTIAGSSAVPGSSAPQWKGLPSPTISNLTTYYHAGTKTYVDWNSTSGTWTNVTLDPARVSQINAAFGSQIAAANAAHAAGSSPVTPTSTAAASGSGATPTSSGSATTSGGSGSGGGSLCYPETLRTTKQDRIRFQRYKVGTTAITSPSGTGLGSLKSKGTAGKEGPDVFLSIPNQITDSNSVDWGGSELDPLRSIAANISLKAMKNDANRTVTDLIKNLSGSVFEKAKTAFNNPEYRNAAQIYLAQEAVQAQGLLSRLTGQVANPNLELLFNGPQLRPFTFSFRMTPRQASEARQVKKIIRFFKEGMAVKGATGDVFLKSPNVFKIQFMTGESNDPHKSLPIIKTCALIACDVDYTPDGSYMTIDDPANNYPMTCYQLTLRFSEIEPIYASDYTSLTADEIGY